MSGPLIRVRGLQRHFRHGNQVVKALDGIDLDVLRGDFFAVVGASGSGKSTLLNLLAGLDTCTGGTIEIDGYPLADMNKRELSMYRANRVGMMFQSFNLIQQRNALQNVELALYFSQITGTQRRKMARDVLETLGLGDRLTHKPADLSGGEQQRVALARALVKQPDILFADEPTGNLDQDNSNAIVNLLKEMNSNGLTVVLVTHDLEIANRCAKKMVRLRYGKRVDTDADYQEAEPGK